MGMRASSLANNPLAVTRELDGRYDVVLEVRDALPEIERLLSLIDGVDKYLAYQSISNILYDSRDNPIKIRYNNNTDVDYEVLTYSGDILTTIQHYINSVLRGTTTLSYSGENLISAIFVGV